MPVGREDVERLIEEHQLTACFGCGKCTAACPLSKLFGDLQFGATPRGIVERALVDPDKLTGEVIWYCLTCDVCTDGCPCGVKLRDFIEGMRELLLAAGEDQYGVRCRQCRHYFLPEPYWGLVRELVHPVGEPPAFLFLCPRCRRVDISRRLKVGK